MFELPKDFWNRVNRTPGGCWEWTISNGPKERGWYRFAGRKIRPYRLVMLSMGHEIEGKCVLHGCDNPRCVNPSHLSVGTHAENMADFSVRGHGNRGDSNGMSRYSEAQILEIKSKYEKAPRSSGGARARKGTLQSLAKEYGCAVNTINVIVHGHRWKHVGGNDRG